MTPTPTSSPPPRPRPRRRTGPHHAALRHFVRGLSYGTGLTVAGLLGYWLQQLL